MLSRVADSLYWLARYIERAENNARILDVNLQVTLDDNHEGTEAEHLEWEPIIDTLEDRKVFEKLYQQTSAETVCEFVTFARENPNSIVSCVAGAHTEAELAQNIEWLQTHIDPRFWQALQLRGLIDGRAPVPSR